MALSILLFVVSCGPGSGDDVLQYNFQTGTSGLQIDLFENAPPREIYQDSSFGIAVELDNQAAYDIPGGIVTIVGLDQTYFYVFPPEQPFGPLLGRSALSPSGDKTVVEFSGQTHKLLGNAEKHMANYIVKVNYVSEMEFTDTVCINPQLYAVYDSGCELDDTKSYSGQGAPLAITKMEEIISPGGNPRVEFRLFLKNRGRGDVGTVVFDRAQLGGKPLDCHFQRSGLNEKEIQLTEKKQDAVLICKMSLLHDLSSYTTTINVHFRYDYELQSKERVTLVK